MADRMLVDAPERFEYSCRSRWRNECYAAERPFAIANVVSGEDGLVNYKI